MLNSTQQDKAVVETERDQCRMDLDNCTKDKIACNSSTDTAVKNCTEDVSRLALVCTAHMSLYVHFRIGFI